MAETLLKNLTDAELRNAVERMFEEKGLAEYYDIAEISTAQIRAALDNNFKLIKNFDIQMATYLGAKLSQAIATKSSPLDLKRELIRDGQIQALEITDKNGNKRTISAETRAANIARTELFKSYEETQYETAKEIMDEPVGIAHTARDSSVRPNHILWEGHAMLISDWDNADEKPGSEPNCRCNLEIIERRNYDGELETSLPF